MQISETQFKKLPEHLKHLFKKLPNPGSEHVLAGFPNSTSTGGLTPGIGARNGRTYEGGWGEKLSSSAGGFGDTGSAARFFYCAKASKRDRDEGLDDMPEVQASVGDKRPGGDFNERLGKTPGVRRNTHPTVKPTDLMAYLCRLVTPPGGVVLDPFMGSGSTGKAAVREGFHFVGIEREAEYLRIAQARISMQIAATSAQQIPPPQEDLFSGILRA